MTKKTTGNNKEKLGQAREQVRGLTFTVLGAGHNGYCDRCQRPRSEGGFVHRNWPTTNFRVLCKCTTTGDENTVGGLCTDCLVEARRAGVTVLGADGLQWVVEGMMSRGTNEKTQAKEGA